MIQEQYILALNVGSTSIKSRVFVFKEGKFQEKFNWSKTDIDSKKGHKKAFLELRDSLRENGVVDGITAVGHRVVHGGPIKKSVKLNAENIKTIAKYSELAPLHNPYNLEGIVEAKKWFGRSVSQVAVFDTAFYANLPRYASTYAIPEKYASRYNFFRYGFHGTSHNYAMLEAARILKKPVSKLKLITVHLGGGSSITAASKGRAIDTSMGFTPLEGLVMGTRSGDIDPGIIFYLADKAKLSWKEIKNILVNESGIYGLCGAKNMLVLLDRVKNRDSKAELAFQVFVYRIQKYIGAYAAVLGGCDAVVFTGAVGSGNRTTRNRITRPLKNFILRKTPVLTVKPNEEKMIAIETLKTLDL